MMNPMYSKLLYYPLSPLYLWRSQYAYQIHKPFLRNLSSFTLLLQSISKLQSNLSTSDPVTLILPLAGWKIASDNLVSKTPVRLWNWNEPYPSSSLLVDMRSACPCKRVMISYDNHVFSKKINFKILGN